MSHKTFRLFAICLLLLVQMFTGITPALAAPPANDNFADALSIDVLPFSHTTDNTEAGSEPDEQQWCNFMPNTVWYTFTAASAGAIRIDMAGTAFSGTMLNVYQDHGTGMTGLSFLGCTTDFGDTGNRSLTVEAGATYYFQAGSYNGETGELHLNLQTIPPPANDNHADAQILSSTIPLDVFGDSFASTNEAGEPMPSCSFIDPDPSQTVWYSFTPAASGTVSAWLPSTTFTPVIAVYTGSSLDSLAEIGCQNFSSLLTLAVTAGATYYFQVGNLFPWEQGGTFQLHIEQAPPPQAGFFYSPSDPSRFDTINFQTSSNDPANIGIESFAWEFGDGSTGSDSSVAHKYADDGDYQVTHTVTTFDGRTASFTQTVQVRTHDVAIMKINAPLSANAGQMKTITVSLRNNNTPEVVQIELFKSTPTGFVWVGTVVRTVPVLAGNRTTNINFSYTFTSEDVAIGKVTFKAVATLLSARDALLADNEAISSPPTRVGR
jgi:hypothetical protein